MATLFFPFGSSFDGNGAPRAGATISFFQTGTSTPQNTFTDSTLGTIQSNPVVADANGLFPAIYLSASFDYKAILKDSSGVTIATRDPLGFVPAMSLGVVPNYLTGLTLSAAGGTGTFGVAAGTAADSTNLAMMTLPLAFTKTTAAWAQGSGAGSLDTGIIANSTWYHAHEIYNPASGLVDIVTSLSATSPTLPTGYTRFRRIGSPLLTDGSAHWVAFKQDGDDVQWITPVQDISVTVGNSTANTITLGSIPTGVRVTANLQPVVSCSNVGAAALAYFSDLSTGDIASSGSFTDIPQTAAAGPNVQLGGSRVSVKTNTAAQIRYRFSNAPATTALVINTLGWTDRRGKDG
jgi:hypothetical protein